jgi:hypothetical protein
VSHDEWQPGHGCADRGSAFKFMNDNAGWEQFWQPKPYPDLAIFER